MNPDWTGGWANEFRYKSVALNVLVDFRHGGQNFSVGNWWGQYAGILESTLKGREVDWDKPGLIIDGIDKRRASRTRRESRRRTTTTPCIRSTKPASSTRASPSCARCASAGTFPQQLVDEDARRRRCNLAFVGRNLLTWTNFPNYDPENSTNASNGGQGYDMGAMPTTRYVRHQPHDRTVTANRENSTDETHSTLGRGSPPSRSRATACQTDLTH